MKIESALEKEAKAAGMSLIAYVNQKQGREWTRLLRRRDWRLR